MNEKKCFNDIYRYDTTKRNNITTCLVCDNRIVDNITFVSSPQCDGLRRYMRHFSIIGRILMVFPSYTQQLKLKTGIDAYTPTP